MRIYTRKTKTDCKNKMDIFEFKDEAEGPEIAMRIKSKIGNPSEAMNKYLFLEKAAAGKNIPASEINYVPSFDMDAINIDPAVVSLEVEEDTSAKMKPYSDDIKVAIQLPQFRAEVGTPAITDGTATTVSASPSKIKLNSAIPDPLPSVPELLDDVVDMVSDENEGACERSSSASSDIAEDDGVFAGPSSGSCVGGWEMDNEDATTVVLYPEYMVYRDCYWTDSVVTFTSSYIEMEGSTEDGDNKTLTHQWAIDDIFHIRSHWYERVEEAMVKIYLLPKDTIETENPECTSGTVLKFAVTGSFWHERCEAITSLNKMYKALWSSMLESEELAVGHAPVSLTKYFPNFGQPFEEVVYPKGDVDAVSISKRDVDLLQPETFVNDTIIDFYIKYLKNKIKPEEKHRFHFFNSFFFRKLADPDKDPLDASEGRAAFQRVRKWTRKVNLFEKDFVFVPVNYNYHWSLLVMCHLGEVDKYQEEDVNESIKVPCVLHMDSIRGSHTGLKGLLQSYLKEEWKERQLEASEDISSRFDNLRFISLELPQQQNSFDCGLFLLHYVELFLEEAPINFNPFNITKSTNFLTMDWFQPADASLKRVVIQRLIYDLLEHPSQEAPAAGNDEHCNFGCHKSVTHKGTAMDLFAEKCNPSMACQSSQAEHGCDISLLPSSSLTSAQCVGEPSIVLNSFFEPGSLIGSQHSALNQSTAFDEYKSSLNPIEVESGGQFFYPTEDGLQQQNGITAEVSTLPCSSQDFQSRRSWHPVTSEHVTEQNCIESSPEPSISGCEDAVEEVNGSDQLDAGVSFKVERDQPSSPLRMTIREPIEMLDGNANGDDVLPGLSSHYPDVQQNGFTGSDNSSGLELEVHHPAKKLRMTEAPLEEGGITSSPSKDLHL